MVNLLSLFPISASLYDIEAVLRRVAIVTLTNSIIVFIFSAYVFLRQKLFSFFMIQESQCLLLVAQSP